MKKTIALLLCLSTSSWATYSLLVSTIQPQGAAPNTTSPINTTGADLIVVVTEVFGDNNLSDSQSNTWTSAITESGFGRYSRISYCRNPSTSSSHTFSDDGVVPRMAIYAFSGSVSTPLDQTNHFSQNGGTTVQPGSVTPTEDNELLVIGTYEEAIGTSQTSSIDSSFTGVLQTGDGVFDIFSAYKIQTTAGSENPTITFPQSNNVANVVIATFKGTGGGAAAAGFNKKAKLMKLEAL